MHKSRPAVEIPEENARTARAAVDRLVVDLQEGLDHGDAEVYNRRFAADVHWGGPYGTIVAGYDQLHAIHTRLLAERRAGPSRYVIEDVLVPAEGVAVAHVRRSALGADGQELDPDAGFSETALYVLVERDGEWWLAAGQNTPLRPSHAASHGPVVSRS